MVATLYYESASSTRRSPRVSRLVLGAKRPYQLSQLPARIKHAGLHSGGRNAENPHALRDRLLVIVNKVDDLSMLGREPGQRFPQKLAAVLLLQRSLRIIRRIG